MDSDRVYLLASTETRVLNEGLMAAGHLQPPEHEFPGGVTHAADGETSLCGLRIGDGGLRLWPNERFGGGSHERECATCRRLAGMD